MIHIHGTITSRARRALWAAEEAGVDYRFVSVDLRRGEHLGEAFRALNPNSRVPTMVHGDLVLFESAAIARYIAAQAPDKGLLPEPGSRDAALLDQWMFWICTELEQPLWSMGKHRFALPREHRIPAMRSTALFEWGRVAPVLAAALDGREFLVGDRFTVADLFAAQTLGWAAGFEVPFGSDVLTAYWQRMIARPAYERTNSPPTA